MKIIKLTANNIKKLKAVEITPKGDVVIISGKNGQGKTNVLESIWYALAGSKDIPSEPIQKGKEKGDIELDLGEYIVTRKFTKGGENTYLEVKNKEGAKFPSPQVLLDKLIGDVSFNPIDLMKANNRDEMLLDIAGLSGKLVKLEEERTEKYNQRTFENREVKKLEAQIIPDIETFETLNIAKLTEEYQVASTLESRIENIDKQIQDWEADIKDLTDRVNHQKIELEVARDKRETIRKPNQLKAAIAKAEETNQKARDYEANEKVKAEYKNRKDAADLLTKDIEGIDKQKKELIEKAKFPVSGMGYRDGKVTFKDIPLDQLSKSEEVLLGVQIQMELHPELKVILIPDASLLDSESMANIEKLSKDRDYQLWIERVDDTGEVGIYIEDGTIKSKGV